MPKDLHILSIDHFPALLTHLQTLGYEIIGPTIRDNAIVFDHIDTVEALPQGWVDEQAPAHYRLHKSKEASLFACVNGPSALKPYVDPPQVRLVQAQRDNGGFSINPQTYPAPKRAFIGVRACDLAALAIQDRIFLQGPYIDPIYEAYRANMVIIAVNCTRAAPACFCTSMNTGPHVTQGYDLALTEINSAGGHYFVVQVGSELGASLLEQIPHTPAPEETSAQVQQIAQEVATHIERHLETDGLPEMLQRNLENPHWEAIAQRCLACGNCTMVCPTCFCTTIEDTTDLTGQHAERWRRWDSCFTGDFSYIHGGSIRATTRARYRQWLTHKLSTWVDQFGVMGCVGCGRCITWCPVGIDLVAEIITLQHKGTALKQVPVSKPAIQGES